MVITLEQLLREGISHIGSALFSLSNPPQLSLAHHNKHADYEVWKEAKPVYL